MRVLVLLLAACGTTTLTTSTTCDVDVTLDPAEAAPGDLVSAVGGSMSERYDTSVRFGTTDAVIAEVTRQDCTLCDACRAASDCTACDTCTECVASCEACVQSATFVVPALPDGTASLILTNRYGSTDPLSLTVTAPVDSGDTGATR